MLGFIGTALFVVAAIASAASLGQLFVDDGSLGA